MLFNSAVFAAFFAVFFPLYLVVRKHVVARNVLLLVASYFFYGWWNPRFVTLLAILAAVDYLAALGVAGKQVTHFDRFKGAVFTLATTAACSVFMDSDGLWLIQIVAVFVGILVAATYLIERSSDDRRARYWLYLSIAANLGVLAYFKYANFFIDSVRDALAAVGWHVDEFTLHVILPIGLSFHVFQGISRTVDCYRGVIKPEGSLVTVATYLAFFPQLVAGPIERASHLIPQFESVRPLNWQLISSGALLFIWGLFQKLVVADNVAPIANHAFENSATIDGATAVAGVLAFTFQIYGDFAGYSNMARGLARCLGFDLMANFNLPYFSRTPSEFWQRWHISLSSWLRDYLYIQLGGNRHGQRMMYRNLMITMLLGGLWHGAAWTFVIWGAFHGAIQVIYRLLRVDAIVARYDRLSFKAVVVHGTAWLCTMALVMIGWIFFRAQSFDSSVEMIGNLLDTSGYRLDKFTPIFAFVAPLLAVEIFQRFRNTLEPLSFRPFMLHYTVVLTVILSIAFFAAEGGQEFIYFDF
jgi:D-alanyl-lipoteichoic acid acyltransferase DltB (MBOAT superfamily)